MKFIHQLPNWPFTLFCVFIIWVLLRFQVFTPTHTSCAIKAYTGLDCLGCGTSSSINHILNGDFVLALEENPLGYLAILLGVTFGILLLIKNINHGKFRKANP